MSRRRTARRIGVLLVVLVIAGCHAPTGPTDSRWDPPDLPKHEDWGDVDLDVKQTRDPDAKDRDIEPEGATAGQPQRSSASRSS